MVSATDRDSEAHDLSPILDPEECGEGFCNSGREVLKFVRRRKHHMEANSTPLGAPRLELLTTDDIARALGVTPAAVRRLFLLKRIPGRRVGKRYVCVKESFERWLDGDHT